MLIPCADNGGHADPPQPYTYLTPIDISNLGLNHNVSGNLELIAT
jgi:hypothetical protein